MWHLKILFNSNSHLASITFSIAESICVALWNSFQLKFPPCKHHIQFCVWHFKVVLNLNSHLANITLNLFLWHYKVVLNSNSHLANITFNCFAWHFEVVLNYSSHLANITFSGLTSRCITPDVCMKASALSRLVVKSCNDFLWKIFVFFQYFILLIFRS